MSVLFFYFFGFFLVCSSSRSVLLRTLPTAVIGSSVRNSISLMALYGATLALTNVLMSSSVAVAPSLSTMKAFGISPAVLSGLPITAQSLTAGCSYSTSSISLGYTL